MKTIPKKIRGCALQYIRYKIKNTEKYDGTEFKFKELGDRDWRWAFLEMYWQPVWKWLLWLEVNKLRCEKSNIEKFNEMLIEDEGREIGTVQKWQAVIAEFIKECENGFRSQVVEALNKSAVGSQQSAVGSQQPVKKKESRHWKAGISVGSGTSRFRFLGFRPTRTSDRI